jgi:hypothetical protein
MAKTKQRYQLNSFAGIPRIVLDCPDYIGLPFSAKALLIEFCRQYRKDNNGDLTAAWSLMKTRGFHSKSTVKKIVEALLNANLIVRTREGKFSNPGGVCALYALSWLPIDECPGKGLDIQPTIKPPRPMSLEINKNPGPQNGQGSVHKIGRQRERDSRGKYVSS